MLLLSFLIVSSIISIDDDFIEITEQFTSNFLVGFTGNIAEDLIYQTATSASLDSTDEDCNDDTDIDLIIFSCNFNSFFTFFSTVGGDLAFDTIESFTAVSAALTGLFIIGLDNALSESYNATLAAWLWPFFTILELLTVIFRCISLAIRITSNGLAGHILLGLITLGFTLVAEFALFWVLPVIILIVGALTFIIQIIELLVTCIQSYVWAILSISYSNTVS